jgi:Ca2+-binding EF-hand superfamily protein
MVKIEDIFPEQIIARYKGVFTACDKDGDGKILRGELGTALQILRLNPTRI